MKEFLNEIKNKYNKIKSNKIVKEEFEKKELFYTSDLDINTNEKGLRFYFHPPGWYFDTTDVGEGVAIIKGSHYKNNKELRAIAIPDVAKSNLDVEQALYWLTGGNRLWKFGQDDYINVSWDNIYKDVVKEWGSFVKKSVLGSKTLGDLLDKFKDFSETEFLEWAFDHGFAKYEDEEEEVDNTEEDKNVKKVDPNQGTLDLEEQEIDEMSTTASVGGYNTPFAFKKNKKTKKTKKVK